MTAAAAIVMTVAAAVAVQTAAGLRVMAEWRSGGERVGERTGAVVGADGRAAVISVMARRATRSATGERTSGDEGQRGKALRMVQGRG